MKLAYDLHIHTALSPCADNDMTPNNIINMSILKGLEVIAVTDHNSCENVKACMACAENKPLLVIPGMEVETAEEIHVICLFPELKYADEMQAWVYSHLPKISNNESVFGTQLVMNAHDDITHIEKRLLLTSAAISINQIFEVVEKRLNGVAIPAHIDRQANSILSSFGVMPEDICINCVEIRNKVNKAELVRRHKSLKKIKKIYSSDAHYLGDISERENFIEVDTKSIESIIGLLRGGI